MVIVGAFPSPSLRHQDPDLRPTAHGLRDEEGYREFGL